MKSPFMQLILSILSIVPVSIDVKPPMWRSNHVIGTICQLHWIIYLFRPTDSLAC